MLYKNKYPIPEETNYVIEYIYDGDKVNYYYELIRIEDNAILFATETLSMMYLECWRRGFVYDEVTLI